MNLFLEELTEEFLDFFEDFAEQILRKKPKKVRKQKEATLYGTRVAVRPAYVFAERIENLLKIIFGVSIFISALISSFWGVTGLSDLLKFLINSTLGRGIMLIIGLSYFTIGVWKIARLKR